MTDYSYCAIHTRPPRPTITMLIWLESWVRPVRGWTKGTAYSGGEGATDARLQWEIRRGKAREASGVGLVHTCGTPSSCRCNTDRQLPQKETA